MMLWPQWPAGGFVWFFRWAELFVFSLEIYESLRPQHQNYLIKIDFIPRRRRIDRYIDVYLGNPVFSGDTFFFLSGDPMFCGVSRSMMIVCCQMYVDMYEG